MKTIETLTAQLAAANEKLHAVEKERDGLRAKCQRLVDAVFRWCSPKEAEERPYAGEVKRLVALAVSLDAALSQPGKGGE